MNGIYHTLKRVFDFSIASLGLVILSPVLIIIAITIKLDSKGPVLFRQKRTGKNGRVFVIYKFRTMIANNDITDRNLQDKHTRVGTFLRQTSLDELPQLLNVIKGDMAIIGPRPWITDYLLYMNPTERGRLAVRPGITGLAQAKGRNGLDIHEKIAYDLEYVENFGFEEDLKVLHYTLKSLLPSSHTLVEAGKAHIYTELDQLKAAI